MVIGRSDRADIHVDNPHVSRRHCQVHWDGCRVWVHDLNTTSGTYINRREGFRGVHVAEPVGSLLRLGDTLHPGPVRIRLSTSWRVEAAWLTWHDGLLVSMAQQMYDSRDFTDMPVLADALEEAGVTDTLLLKHLRGPGPHVRGCFAIDAILGRA